MERERDKGKERRGDNGTKTVRAQLGGCCGTGRVREGAQTELKRKKF